MQLSVKERLLLLTCLPAESDILTLRILRELKTILGFNGDEFKEYGFKQEGGNISWNPEVLQDKDIPIGEKAADIIVEALKTLNAKKALTEAHIPLWEKFVAP